MSHDESYEDRGLQVLVDLGWIESREEREPPRVGLDQKFWDHTLSHLLGMVWARPGLPVYDREICVLAVLTAVASHVGSVTHLRKCHAIGIDERKLRELIILTGNFAGWPASDRALTQLDSHLQEPDSSWPSESRMARDESDDVDPEEVLRRLVDPEWGTDDTSWAETIRGGLTTRTKDDLKSLGSGDLSLTPRERQIVAIASLIAMNSDLLKLHLENAHRHGFDEQRLRELIMQAGYYCGWPKFAEATVRFNAVLGNPATTWPEEKRLAASE